VLYRGSVAEAGDVELVVKDPKHPYTQLLVGSVPRPDPRQPWGSYTVAERGAANGRDGCKFADRCPLVMDICRTNRPPLYRTDPHRAATCFLHRDDAEALSSDQLDEVLNGLAQPRVGDLV